MFELALPDDIVQYYINYENKEGGKLKVPHITVSLGKDAKAVDTYKLDFVSLKRPFVLVGKFGYLIKDGKNEFVSYDKYNSNTRK